MKIAVFSDIHGNIIGTKKILSHIKQNGGSDITIAAGDIIGGSSGAEDLLELLFQNEVLMLKGNGEELYTSFDKHINNIPSEFREYFNRMNEWLHSKIPKHYWDLLANLSISTTININNTSILVCHAAPDNPWGNACAPYAEEKDLESDYGNVNHKIIAYGHYHSHHIMTYKQKILINVASVGLRTDGTTCYTLIENIGENILIKQFTLKYNRGQEIKLNSQLRVPIQKHI